MPSFWSVVISPTSAPLIIVPDSRILLKSASIDCDIPGKRVTFSLQYELFLHGRRDVATVKICSLTSCQNDNFYLDFHLEAGRRYILAAIGDCAMHLFGNMHDKSEDNTQLVNSSNAARNNTLAYSLLSFDAPGNPAPAVFRDNKTDAIQSGDPQMSVHKIASTQNLDLQTSRSSRSPARGVDPTQLTPSTPNKKTSSSLKKTPIAHPDYYTLSASPTTAGKKAAKMSESQSPSKPSHTIPNETPISRLNNKVDFVDVSKGVGEKVVQYNHIILICYVARLESGNGHVYERESKGIRLVVGGEREPLGLHEGVLGMKIGGQRRIFIPSRMGYGSEGKRGVVPPDSKLVFDCLVKDILNTGAGLDENEQEDPMELLIDM